MGRKNNKAQRARIAKIGDAITKGCACNRSDTGELVSMEIVLAIDSLVNGSMLSDNNKEAIFKGIARTVLNDSEWTYSVLDSNMQQCVVDLYNKISKHE